VIPAADISNLLYTPAPSGNGEAYASFDFNVTDNGTVAGGGWPTSVDANTFTFNVTPVNDAPIGSDKTLNTDESSVVQFESLPLTGELLLENSPVSASVVINVSDIDNGSLTYIPALAEVAESASFDFTVTDDGGTLNSGEDTAPNANTITIQIAIDNNPPTGSDQILTLQEDESHTLAAEDFGFTDAVDGHSLAGVIIATLPANGSLTNNGVVVSGVQSTMHQRS